MTTAAQQDDSRRAEKMAFDMRQLYEEKLFKRSVTKMQPTIR